MGVEVPGWKSTLPNINPAGGARGITKPSLSGGSGSIALTGTFSAIWKQENELPVDLLPIGKALAMASDAIVEVPSGL